MFRTTNTMSVLFDGIVKPDSSLNATVDPCIAPTCCARLSIKHVELCAFLIPIVFGQKRNC